MEELNLCYSINEVDTPQGNEIINKDNSKPNRRQLCASLLLRYDKHYKASIKYPNRYIGFDDQFVSINKTMNKLIDKIQLFLRLKYNPSDSDSEQEQENDVKLRQSEGRRFPKTYIYKDDFMNVDIQERDRKSVV